MPGFINVRRFHDGRVTVVMPESTLSELQAMGTRVSEKILSIREIDNLNLMPIEGRQVYLSEHEFEALKTTGLLAGTDKVRKIYGYQIITDEDLK